MSRSVEQRPNDSGFPKPGELIDIRSAQELTLQDRRVFNLLIENAWPQITADVWHEISMVTLRGNMHQSNDRVSESILRLMTTIVEVPSGLLNGLPAIRTTVLVSENERTIAEDDPRSMVRYKLTETLRKIISQSQYWGRIKAHVIFAFSSKYSLTLYEAVCLRANLNISSQDFSVEEFRKLIDVQSGRLIGFPQLKQKAITPATLEINALSEFVVEVEPLRFLGRRRGSLEGFRLSWRRKSKEEWSDTLSELLRNSTGRKARIRGTVEPIAA